MSQESKRERQIVIADDEKAIRQGLHFLIKQHHRDVTILEASNGQECWEILSVEPLVELTFVDIRMPGMDGLQVCEKIKTAELRTKMVIISGFRDFEYARQALHYGVTDYLLKPVNPSDVLRLVRDVMLLPPPVLESIDKKQEHLMVEQVRKWIHEHLHEDITLLDLCQRFHYSVSYISALFKKEMGKGFQEYLADCRLARAKHLLLDPALRISNIAQQVGYTNAKAFSIAFRKASGLTPTEYRERRGIEAPL